MTDFKSLTGADVQAALMLLDVDLDGGEFTADQVEVRLAMLARGEDAMDSARAEALLDSPAHEYLAYVAPVMDQKEGRPVPAFAPDGQTATVVLSQPIGDLATVTVRQLKGRDWRLAVNDAQSLPRLAAMTGLTLDQVQALAYPDYFAIEEAMRPFVVSVFEALLSGGDSSQPSSATAPDSPG